MIARNSEHSNRLRYRRYNLFHIRTITECFGKQGGACGFESH